MTYQNPILRGFNPDPSICRVGDDYYLVTSTFEFFPGIPVYHSRDLVNWAQIGNCIHRPGQLPMDRETHNEGIWAGNPSCCPSPGRTNGPSLPTAGAIFAWKPPLALFSSLRSPGRRI